MAFAPETAMARPPKGPIFLLKNHNSKSMLPRADKEDASASPPCCSGPIRARLQSRFSRKAIKAVSTGVLVSFSA